MYFGRAQLESNVYKIKLKYFLACVLINESECLAGTLKYSPAIHWR